MPERIAHRARRIEPYRVRLHQQQRDIGPLAHKLKESELVRHIHGEQDKRIIRQFLVECYGNPGNGNRLQQILQHVPYNMAIHRRVGRRRRRSLAHKCGRTPCPRGWQGCKDRRRIHNDAAGQRARRADRGVSIPHLPLDNAEVAREAEGVHFQRKTSIPRRAHEIGRYLPRRARPQVRAHRPPGQPDPQGIFNAALYAIERHNRWRIRGRVRGARGARGSARPRGRRGSLGGAINERGATGRGRSSLYPVGVHRRPSQARRGHGDIPGRIILRNRIALVLRARVDEKSVSCGIGVAAGKSVPGAPTSPPKRHQRAGNAVAQFVLGPSADAQRRIRTRRLPDAPWGKDKCQYHDSHPHPTSAHHDNLPLVRKGAATTRLQRSCVA